MIQSSHLASLSSGLLLVLITCSLPAAQGDELNTEGGGLNVQQSQLTLAPIGKNFILSAGLARQRPSTSAAYSQAANEYVVVWHELGDTAAMGNDIYGQRVSAAGRLRGRNIPVVTEVESQSDPTIVYNLVDNNYLVAWKQQSFDRDRPDFNDAFGQILSSGGQPGSAFRISNAGLEISGAYDLLHNNYLVTGRAYTSGPANGIFGRIVSHDGAPIGTEIAIDTISFPAPNGDVVYNPRTNEYFATWRDQINDDLKGQRLAASGAPIGKPHVISAVFPEDSRIAFDPVRNRYLVVFVVFQENKIRGRFVSSSGMPAGASFPIGTLDSREMPAVTYSRRHGTYVLAWKTGNDIIARLLSATGKVVGNALRVTSNDTAAERPSLVANLKTGDFLVAWPDNRNASRGRQDIFAQLFCIKRGMIEAIPTRIPTR